MSALAALGRITPPRYSLGGEMLGFNKRTGQPVYAAAGFGKLVGINRRTGAPVRAMAGPDGIGALQDHLTVDNSLFVVAPLAGALLDKNRLRGAGLGLGAAIGYKLVRSFLAKRAAKEAGASFSAQRAAADGLGSYSELSTDFYKTFQHDNWQHPGSSGWTDANVPGWGNNPNLQMFDRRGTDGLGRLG